MKLLTAALLLSFLALPLFAHAGEGNDPCAPVFKACAAQGFEKDDSAPAGKKIYLNCADVLLNQKKKVDTVDLDPKVWAVTNCRDYRIAKDKFTAEWIKKHTHE